MKLKCMAVAAALSLLISCTTQMEPKKNSEMDKSIKNGLAVVGKATSITPVPYTTSKTPVLAVDKRPVSVEQRMYADLKNINVQYLREDVSGVPLNAILDSLNAQGVNVSAQVDLSRYVYTGFSINTTDALTALEILTGTLGLDFSVEKLDNGKPIVYINSLAAETVTLNIGPRKVTSTMSSTTGGSQQQTQQTQSQGQGQGQGGVQQSSQLTSSSTADVKSETMDDFWTNLKSELDGRLSRPLPVAKSQLSDDEAAESKLYENVTLGSVVINSSTGAVTIMAPRTIRRELVSYLNSLSDQLNTSVVMQGQVILVVNNSEESQGIDWGGLRNTGEGVIAIGNDVMGNAVISAPGEFADVVASNALAPSLIGYQRADKALRAFNGYLAQDSNTKTLQMPVAQTSSGTPVNLTDVQNDVQILANTQQSTTEGGTTNTGATNQILTYQYGTNLTLTPRVDIEKGIIRTSVNLKLVIKQGTKTANQVIYSDGRSELSPLDLPLIKELGYQGEVILKPGEVIVVGGQTVELIENNDGGITGLKDSWLGGLFGSKKGRSNTVTYYFLLSAYTVPYGA